MAMFLFQIVIDQSFFDSQPTQETAPIDVKKTPRVQRKERRERRKSIILVILIHDIYFPNLFLYIRCMMNDDGIIPVFKS